MWWKKVKAYDKQILKNANLDPVPYAKDRLKAEFAKTLLEPLPVEQADKGNAVEFQVEAILLSVPQWEAIKAQLTNLSNAVSPDQQETITQIIAEIEKSE